jgi:Dipeptidyl aminopeptidases/acylaminoacyl-peptidases
VVEVDVGPKWVEDKVYFVVHEGGSANLYSIDINDGSLSPVTFGYRSVEGFDVASKSGEHLVVFTSMTDTYPIELYLIRGGKEIQLTNFNLDFVREFSISKPEHFSFTASDGAEIDGWIMKPLDFDPSKKYPAILYIHGGPKTAYGASFIHEFQVYAARGYVIIYTNPRGLS